MDRRLYILLVLVLAAVTGCQKPAVSESSEHPEKTRKMMVSVRTDNPEPRFTFVFWNKKDFDEGISSGVMPYFVASPPGDIGDYQEPEASGGASVEDRNDYNTGREYPENYGIAVCTGYGPYDKVTPSAYVADPSEKDYTLLEVTGAGVTDVLVSRNYLEGSSIFPFSGNLDFFHPQIQLTIKAKLAESMAKYIRGLSFSVGGKNLLKSLRWDNAAKQYLPSGEEYDGVWTSDVTSEYLNKTDERTLGTVLVVPEPAADGYLMESIDLTLTGLISNTNMEPGSGFSMKVTAGLTGVSGGGLSLGDSYEILLLFDEDQIEITAVAVPWEEGGNVLVPVHPIPE